MHETIRFSIKGVVPTIMCNGQTADPLNKFAKDMKKISSKKTKTVDDHMEMARLEWFACVYADDKGRPCWPSENIESMIVKSASKQRKGTDAKAAIFVTDHAPIIYDGPKTIEGLWKFKSFDNNPFISRVPVVINRSRVMRTRPIFRDWSLQFDVNFLTDTFDKEQVIHIVQNAGRMIGLSDWRPKYGRFMVTKVQSIEFEDIKEEINEQTREVDGGEAVSEEQRVLEEASS